MERLNNSLDRLLIIGGRSPHQVARTMCIIFLCLWLSKKLKQRLFSNGFRYAMMQFAFILYSKYQGKEGMDSKLNEVEKELEKSLIPTIIKTYEKNVSLPLKSMNEQQLITLLTEWSEHEESLWNGQKHYESGTVYHGELSLKELQNKAYCLFSITNPLHPNTFPFVRKMESEIIAMTLPLFHGSVIDGKQCGIVSSGGTESIILAIRAYKNYYREHKHITKPELVIPRTAHAAFDKACDLMDIKLIKVDIDKKTYCVNVKEMEKYITSDTIAIVGSTPQYAHGTMDDIESLSKLAIKYDIGLHVDCCLGSFLMPLLSQINNGDKYKYNNIPSFDFRLDGVTSISCDTHKYGFSNKGTSVLMFKDKSFRKHAYFCYSDVTMGMYSTPTCMGSRSGGLIAATWATMMYFGKDGYLECMKEIMDAVEKVKAGIREIEEIEIMGNPIGPVLAFKEKDKYKSDLEIFKVAQAMGERGWSLSRCQHPNCVHFAFTIANCKDPDKFVLDFKDSVIEVMESPERFKSGSGAMYGAVASIPSTGFKNDILSSYMDVVYGVY